MTIPRIEIRETGLDPADVAKHEGGKAIYAFMRFSGIFWDGSPELDLTDEEWAAMPADYDEDDIAIIRPADCCVAVIKHITSQMDGFQVSEVELYEGAIQPDKPSRFGLKGDCENGGACFYGIVHDYAAALAHAQRLIDDKLREREHYLPRLQSSLLDGAAETSA